MTSFLLVPSFRKIELRKLSTAGIFECARAQLEGWKNLNFRKIIIRMKMKIKVK